MVKINWKSVEFIDDNSRWCEVRFIKTKDEVVNFLQDFINLVENRKIKCFQSDNGTEYVNKEMDNLFQPMETARRLSAPYCLSVY